MTKFFVCAVAAASLLALGSAARAQQDPGARAPGGGYVPSTHSPGCKGLLCDSDDPRRAPGAPPPPPCQGLLCSLAPYSMERPVTAGDVQRMQQEQARAAAEAAAAPPEPTARSSKRRKAKAARKGDKAKSVATRTPDPGAAAPEAR